MASYHKLIELVLDALFEPEHRRFDAMIVSLNKQNSERLRTKLLGFNFEGDWYKPKAEANTPPGSMRKGLDESLWPQMQVHLGDVRRVEKDRLLISQLLFKLLHQCNDHQEIRDSLPDCIVDLVPLVSGLNRQKTAPTWIINNDKRALAFYERVLPLIEMYSAARIFY